MPDTILVVVEQREGKLNRVSWETLTAGQAIAAETGWPLEAAVVGGSVGAFASEVAGKKVAKVYAVENAKLDPYTPDAFVAALKQFISTKQPKLVLMPHTYQVRDFVPKLATAMGRTVISDAIGYKKEGDKLVFTRLMFQGKFVADVSFASDAPWFVTFQNGSFRGDKVEAGASAAPVETVTVEIADGVIRNKPQEVFKEAKQAVDLTQAEIIVAVARGRTSGLASDLRLRLAPDGPPDRLFWPDRRSQTLSRARYQWRHPTHRGHEGRAHDRGDQQRLRSPDFRDRRLRRRRQSVRHRPTAD
jgi:electron transfer flavoprotein alpha subunit